jgi:tetratricopeptide (TPR) repeat protein
MRDDSGVTGPVDRRSKRTGRSLRFKLGAVLLLVFAVVGLIVGIRVGTWRSSAHLPELPEIPAVNLDGADPAIVRLVRAARDILEQSPRSAIAWGQFAMVLHAHGFSDSAHTCYDAAARLDPKNPNWPYLRGHLYHDGPGGPEAALPHFELAASLGPPDSLARLLLADMLVELGRFDEAAQEYRKILSIRSNDPQAQLGLARLAMAKGEHHDALQYLEPLAENSPLQNTACSMLANVYDRVGDAAAANRARRKLAETQDQQRTDDPIMQVTQLEVGVRVDLAKAQQLMEQNQVGEMLEMVEDAVHRYPESFEAWAALTHAYGLAGDLGGAERAARRSTQLAPKNAKAWLSHGNVLIRQHRYKDALESVQKSIGLDPRNRQAYLSLGACRKGLGDSAGAAEAYKLAGPASPQQPGLPSEPKEPELPPAVNEYFPFITRYYANPQPEKAKQMLVDLIAPENLDHPWYQDRGFVLRLMAANLGDIGFGRQEMVRYYEGKFAEAPDGGKRIIIQALQICGDKTTQQVVDAWLAEPANVGVTNELVVLKEHLASPDRKRRRDATPREAADLDYLWGDFFATGEYAPISRILDVFDLPDNPASAGLKEAAKLSTSSNFRLHPKLVEIVKAKLDKRPDGSKSAIIELLKDLEKGVPENKK